MLVIWGTVQSNVLKTLCGLIILNLLLDSQLPGHSPLPCPPELLNVTLRS